MIMGLLSCEELIMLFRQGQIVKKEHGKFEKNPISTPNCQTGSLEYSGSQSTVRPCSSST